MRVIVTTDGSKQSLAAARHLRSFADPDKITDILVLAVIRPLAAVAFADELSAPDRKRADTTSLSFREAAQSAVDAIAEDLADWGPKIVKQIRSGSPANEIIKAATQREAGLIVVASGGRGLSDNVLVGSTAQRVQHYAPCPVLVVRPAPRKRGTRRSAKGKGT
ncbi:MAG: universal stress protein [Actinomycetales bacterium]|nr:universal stress protein [Actinomycetales bacterium]